MTDNEIGHVIIGAAMKVHSPNGSGIGKLQQIIHLSRESGNPGPGTSAVAWPPLFARVTGAALRDGITKLVNGL